MPDFCSGCPLFRQLMPNWRWEIPLMPRFPMAGYPDVMFANATNDAHPFTQAKCHCPDRWQPCKLLPPSHMLKRNDTIFLETSQKSTQKHCFEWRVLQGHTNRPCRQTVGVATFNTSVPICTNRWRLCDIQWHIWRHLLSDGYIHPSVPIKI